MKINRIISSALVIVLMFSAIIAAIPFASFASEPQQTPTVSVMKESFPVDPADVEAVAAVCKVYEQYGYGDYAFKDAEEMLEFEKNLNYLDSIISSGYEFYVNRYTGVSYYKNNTTGQVLTSNPIDPAYLSTPASINTVESSVLGQLELSYLQVTDSSIKGTHDSFKWIKEGSLLEVKELKDENDAVIGISVIYTLGEPTDLVAPEVIDADKLLTDIAQPLFTKLADMMQAAYGDVDTTKTYRTAAGKRNTPITTYDIGALEVYMANGKLDLSGSGSTVDRLLSTFDSYGSNADVKTLVAQMKTIFTSYSMLDPEDDVIKMEDNWFKKVPVLNEGKIVYAIGNLKSSNLVVLRKFNAAITKALPTYTIAQSNDAMTECGFVSSRNDTATFRCAMNYTIADDGALVVDIPANSITHSDLYNIVSITPLRFFGSGDMSRDGYIFYPDGSGTIAEFGDFYSDGEINETPPNINVTGKVYGQDYCYSDITGKRPPQQVTMPVYGLVSTVDATATSIGKGSANELTNAFFAIIEEGASLATLAFGSDPGKHKFAYAYSSFAPVPQDKIDLSQSIGVGNAVSYTKFANSGYEGSFKTKYVMLTDPDLGAKLHSESVISTYYEASYVGMAKCYQNYLVQNETITALTTAYEDIPLYIEALGSLDVTQRILTFPVTVSEALTTFEDVEMMYDQLSTAIETLKTKAADARAEADALPETEILHKEQLYKSAAKYEALAGEVRNIRNINFRLTGFANGGMYFTYPAKVKWESSVGGKKGFKALLAAAVATSEESQKNFQVYPDFDFVYISNTSSFDGVSKNSDAAKYVDNRYATKQVYESVSQKYESLFSLIVSSTSLDKLYGKFDKKFSKFESANLSVSTLGSDLNSNFDEDGVIVREESLKNVGNVLSKMSEKYSLMTNVGNAYSLKYVDHILNATLDSSHFVYSSYTVPFFGMVLHGYVNYAGAPLNYSGSPDYDILRAIENGASLYYILCCENTNYLKADEQLSDYYGVDYENWFTGIVEQYNTLAGAIGDLQLYNIVDHKVILAERIIKGDEMYLNYTRLAEEFVGEMDKNISNEIDIAIKGMRHDPASITKDLKFTADRDALITKLAQIIRVNIDSDNAETKSAALLLLGAMKNIGTDADFRVALDEKLDSLKATYPEAQGATVIALSAADITFANLGADTTAENIASKLEAYVSAKYNALISADNPAPVVTLDCNNEEIISAAVAMFGLLPLHIESVESLDKVISKYENDYSSTRPAAEVVEVVFGDQAADLEYASLYSYTTDSVCTDKKGYVYTDFTCDNGNVVMVTYRNAATGHTVDFILNYNNFAVDVVVEAGKDPITIDSCGYIRR